MPTIKDVAEVSGYSVCTVSKALSGKGNIREDTRRKILAVVEEIGYHPNRLAVSLKTGRTNSLALIVPDVTNIYFPRLEKYVEQYASQKGYMVFLCDAGNSFEREKNFIEELSRGRVDGVIVTPSTPEHDHIMRLKELGIPCIINTYGPTETTISSNMARLEGNEITVGRPLLNVREYIVDKKGEIVPRGVAGELLIGGPGVAKGYHGLDAQTAERFIIYKGSRFYRSGDIAKWDEKGNIQIQGRIDGQVKLRGLRIELGEIESVMESFSGMLGRASYLNHPPRESSECWRWISPWSYSAKNPTISPQG